MVYPSISPRFIAAVGLLLLSNVLPSAQAQLTGTSVRVLDPSGQEVDSASAFLNDAGLLTLLDIDGRASAGIPPTVMASSDGRIAPDGGTIGFNGTPYVTPGGSLAGLGGTSVNVQRGVYFTSGTMNRRVALHGESAPGGGVFDSLFGPRANDSGIVAFYATTSGGPGRGIFFGDANGVHALALYTDPAPEGGNFYDFSPGAVVTASGKAFFLAATASQSSFYLGNLSGIVPMPGTTGASSGYINDHEQIMFIKDRSLYLGTVNTSHVAVSPGDAAPIGGTFWSIGYASFNNVGQIAFSAVVGANGQSTDGVFLYTPTGIKTIAQDGLAPGGGTFVLGALRGVTPLINDQGRVAFSADTNSGRRIFMGDGANLVKIVGEGDLLDGHVVKSVSLSRAEGAGSGLSPLNNRGQLVFNDYNYGTYVFTPDGVSTGPLPTVSVAATTPTVTVGTGGKAVVTLNLPAPQSTDVTVNYTAKGTAINGTDYSLLSGHVKIKAGQTSKSIKIVPQGDLGGASKKTVKLTLTPGTDYSLGATAVVKVKILNAN